MIKQNIFKRLLPLSLMALVASAGALPARCDTTIATTEIMACGHLFNIDANADHKTAAERARIVQKNLDEALINAKDRSPSAVKVGFKNHNPIVTMDGFYIVTADNNSAVRAGLSQRALAEKWARSLRHCLSDTAMISKYISSLTGKFEDRRVGMALNRTDVSVLPWGTNLPVAVQSDLNIMEARLGTPITLSLVTDVPLGPNFNTYLPAGTLALGELVNAQPNNPNNYAGKHALMAHFYALQTPDGAQIPISGHVLGGVNSWRATTIMPLQAAADRRVEARLVTSTQPIVASNGNVVGTVYTEKTSKQASLPDAFPGVITGAWKGIDEDTMCQSGFPKLMFSHRAPIFLPAGERMTLQLSATSVVAVSSDAPDSPAIASTYINPGM